MVMRIALSNNLTADGVRWHVIERDKILRDGKAKTQLQASAAAIKVIKEIESERSSFRHGDPKVKDKPRRAPTWLLT